jgi:hypothetical protein
LIILSAVKIYPKSDEGLSFCCNLPFPIDVGDVWLDPQLADPALVLVIVHPFLVNPQVDAGEVLQPVQLLRQQVEVLPIL